MTTISTDHGTHVAISDLVAHGLPKGYLSPNPLDRGKTSPWNFAKSSPLSSPEPPSECSSARQVPGYCLLLALGRGRPLSTRGPVPRIPSNIDCCRNLPRPSASSPLDNRAPPMANASQVPDLEGLHHEIHGMAEQMRIMNENNGRLMQLLAAANPPLPAAPLVPDVERSRHSNRSGNRSRNISADQVGRGRCQAPSSSLRKKSSSESSKTPTRSGRGRSPRRGDHIRARDKSTSQKIRDLDTRLDSINTGAERILRARISSKFKLPTQLGIYEGKTDPMDHLDSYKSLMSLQGCSDEVMCKAFSTTLKGPARSWFRKLSPGTIDSFGDLSRLFVANFMSCRNRQKNASHLFTIHQKEAESLKDFVKRFNQAILEVEDSSDKVIIMAMMEGLRPGPLFDSLFKNVPETLSALQSKADKYIAAEELAEAKRRRRGKDDHKRKEPDTRRTDYREEARYKRPDLDPKRSSQRRPRTPPRRPEFILPPLNAPVAQVLSEIKHEEFVKWPGKIKTDPQKRNRNKFSAPFSYSLDRIWRKYDAPLGMDQLTDNPGRRASPDHRMAGFYCGRLPLALQCHPGVTNFRSNQGDHLDLSPEAKVSHPNRDWRDKGQSESGQTMLHLGHEGSKPHQSNSNYRTWVMTQRYSEMK
ncbi:hypothetical protein Acr_26g0004580 [Actinidia rufa]|uniref:Retrotransposon gag domain-containing protein n=1 Tax=Actinidia rufa TaxID=165716 RepID=A0A7J0H2E3_9ERIC|nr:hypothetical protein Acr_26g0004580 [Actinidia rufa]